MHIIDDTGAVHSLPPQTIAEYRTTLQSLFAQRRILDDRIDIVITEALTQADRREQQRKV